MQYIIITILAILISSWPVSATGEEIYIGGVNIQLGDSLDDATANLRKFNTLQQVGEDAQTWLIRSKSGPPFEVFGTVTGKNGRVATVNKSWTPTEIGSSAEFARLLVASLTSMTASAGSSCTVAPSVSDQPASEFRSVQIRCGSRLLMVTYTHENTGDFAGSHGSITEVIGSGTRR